MRNNWSIDELQDIWQLASKLHDGQKYGGPNDGEQVEYINHIGSVTFEIINAINNSNDINAELAIKCAMLHDTLEDTNFSFEKTKELFGKEVAEGVLALTKNSELENSDEKMKDSLKRIKLQPKEVWAVKLADRICNLYEPPFYWKNEKKLKYIEEAKLILAELKEGNSYLAERLDCKIKVYHKFLDL
ncbi:MAG: HD domain-containing protein [Bacteroidota bacterium]|nr:HD domain-containing protein [Bacteroidota bacterium]